MRIRRATAADIPQIRKLEEQSPTAAHWTQGQYEAVFSSDTVARVVLVATQPAESQLSGFLVARCLPDEWEIENIVVAEAARRRGLASLLIQELAGRARGAGVMSLVLEVRESNYPALQLYENIGFTLEGRRKDYYRSPLDDALLLRLPLQPCDKFP